MSKKIVAGLVTVLILGFAALGYTQLAGETAYDRLMRVSSTYDPGTWYHVEMQYAPGPKGEHGFAFWNWQQMVPPGGEIILKQISLHPEDNPQDTNPLCENIIFHYGYETAASAEFCDTRFGVVQAAGLPISIDSQKAPYYWLQDEVHADGVIIIRHDGYTDKGKYANGAIPVLGGAWWITGLLSDHFLNCYSGNIQETVVAKVDLQQVYSVRRLALRSWVDAIGTPTIKLQVSPDDLTWTTMWSKTGTGERGGGFMWGSPFHYSQDNVSLRYARITQQGAGQVCPMKLFAWVAN